MKISSNNFFNPQSPVNNTQKKASQPSFSSVLNNKNKNCDQIIISSKPQQVSADNFAENISKEICSELKEPISSEKIESLKNEIQNRTYEINIDEIANKLMLD